MAVKFNDLIPRNKLHLVSIQQGMQFRGNMRSYRKLGDGLSGLLDDQTCSVELLTEIFTAKYHTTSITDMQK